MANPNKPGMQTSEWTITKWIVVVCGALAAGLGAVIATGAVVDPTVQAILGGAAAVLGAVAGINTKAYVDGRSLIKAAKAGTPKNPIKPQATPPS